MTEPRITVHFHMDGNKSVVMWKGRNQCPPAEEIAHAVYHNYFPEGTDIDYLPDEFYDDLEQ